MCGAAMVGVPLDVGCTHFSIVVHAVLAFASSGPPAFFISTNFARSFSATAGVTRTDPCRPGDGLAARAQEQGQVIMSSTGSWI